MRRLLLALLLCTTPLLVHRSIAAATDGPPIWRTTNAGGGGALNSPVIDAATGAWAVGSDLSGAYLSTDEGVTWRVLGAAQGLSETHVSALAFGAESRLLIGTERGVDIASPTGDEVVHVADIGYVVALAPAADSTIVYAVAHPSWDQLAPEVWRSEDGGWTWEPIPTDLPSDLRITAARVHPTDPSALLVVSAEGRWPEGVEIANRVYLSENAGATFTRVDPDRGEVYDVRYDLSSPNRVWLTVGTGSGGQLLRSDDAGWSWTEVSDGRSGAIWLDPHEPNRIRLLEVTGHGYGDPASGLWESADGGSTFWSASAMEEWDTHWPGWSWSYAESFQGLLQTVSFSETDSEAALWVTTQWAFSSVDGRTFRSALGTTSATGFHSAGLDNVVPYGVAPSPVDGQRVYSYNWDIGCQRSDDGGWSWQPCNQTWVDGVRVSAWESDNGGDLMTLAPDPTRVDVVWASMAPDRYGAGTRLVRSDAAGESGTWVLSDAGLPPANYLAGLSVDPSSPAHQRRLFVVADGAVYRSVDDGWTWSRVEGCAPEGVSGCQATWIGGPGVLFAGGGAGLFRSDNGGEPGSWTPIGGSFLDGDPWIVAPWEDGFAGVADVFVSPTSAASVWVARFGDGLYHSHDGGDSFDRVREDHLIRTVTVTSDGRVWTGSSSATFHGGWAPDSTGVLVSGDEGATWERAGDGLAWPLVLDLEVGPDGVLWSANAGLGTACFGCAPQRPETEGENSPGGSAPPTADAEVPAG
jgi:hypothetical protein